MWLVNTAIHRQWQDNALLDAINFFNTLPHHNGQTLRRTPPVINISFPKDSCSMSVVIISSLIEGSSK